MKSIHYAPDGEPISDASAEEKALQFLLSDADSIRVSSEVFITAARVLIKEGRFPHDGVQFVFQGAPIMPDVHGRLAHWPNGFCDVAERFLDRLLDLGKPIP